jgi:hypothetical protein
MIGLGSFASGLAAGYGTALGLKQQGDEAKWRDEERARIRADREEADAYKRDLKAAGSPVEVASGEVYQPAVDDDGNAMPANPTSGLWQAGGQQFKSRGLADAYAAQAPGLRQAAVMDRYGKVSEAAALRNSMQSQELGALQLGEAKEQDAARRFARAAVGAVLQGPDAVARFATENYDDGRTYKAVPGQNGGFRLVAHGADGKEVGGKDFAGPEDFISFAVSRGDPSKYVERQDRKAEIAREQGNNDRDYGLRVAGLEVQARNADDQRRLGWANYGLSAARSRREQAQFDADPMFKLPERVKLEFQNNARQIEQINGAITKAQAEGSYDPASPNAKALQTNLSALQARNIVLLNGSGGKQAADPLGLFGDATPAQAAASPAAAQPRQAAAPTPARGPSLADAPTAPRPQPADPLAGMSRAQIRDRRAELVSERRRWAGNPGAARRVSEIDTLIQRIDNGQY